MDVTALTQRLVAFDTVNPPGQEAEAITFCAARLSGAGFACTTVDHGAGRASLIATRGTGAGRAIGFSGHLDTVPLGQAPWRFAPHGGTVAEGRIYGRGTTDMKGAVAAILTACAAAPTPPGGIAVLLTAGEETGCDGARWLVERGGLPVIGALVVGESTLNRAVQGHKGVLWLTLRFRGVTAHGAMPEQGVNAIRKATAAVLALDGFAPGADHPVMGRPSFNVGTIRGGLNTNSVPDLCEVTLDLRSVAGMDHGALIAAVRDRIGPEAEITPLLDLPPVWTPAEDPWMVTARTLAAEVAGAQTDPASVAYFTDASVLVPALGAPPTVILGPGDPALAHKTDESVAIDRLEEAVTIYTRLIAGWCG